MQNLDIKTLAYLPTMLWARTVRHRLDDMSYGKIQKLLTKREDQPNTEWWETCSGRLSKNSNGKTKVRDILFINQIETLAPGTKRILFHPFWKIFINPDASLDEVYSYMKELSFDVQRRLFKIEKITNLPYRIKIKSITVDYIAKMNDLDALACLLMMIREAEITKQIDAYIGCKWRAHQLLCRLATFQPLKSLIEIIYDFIFERFFEKNNPLPKDLAHPLVEHSPRHYTIPSKYPIPRFLDENLLILELAIQNRIISSSTADQLNLLFWIDMKVQRKSILRALIALSSPDESPSAEVMQPLAELQKRLAGNSRKYLPTDNFVI